MVFLFIMPNFKDYLDYFYNFNLGYDATFEVLVSLGILLSTIIYANFLEETEMRKLLTVGIGFYMVNNVFNMLLVTSNTFGLKKFTFVTI
jgi:hypothetical protein